MSWCFGIINYKLSEVFFEKKGKEIIVTGHCYVKESEYKTKTEKRWIKEDTARVRLLYRKGKYKSTIKN